MILTHCSCWWICVNIRIHRCSSRTYGAIKRAQLFHWSGRADCGTVRYEGTRHRLDSKWLMFSGGMLTHQNVKHKLSLQEQLLSCCWFSSTLKCSDLIIQTCFPIWFLYKKEKRNKKNNFLMQIAVWSTTNEKLKYGSFWKYTVHFIIS